MKYLLFFSGGIDSTAVLYKMLQDEPTAEIDVVHLVLKNQENRWEQELVACRNIVDWFKHQGHTFNYVEQVFEYTISSNSFPYDTSVVGFYAAHLIQSKSYDYVTSGVVASDDQTWQGQFRTSVRTSIYFSTALSISPCKPIVAWKYPLIGMTKKEIIKNFLPKDLLELTFSCRAPLQDSTPCGSCVACNEINEILAE
ncbi:MAG: hypothetical protein HC836_47005 [Richelia sp. RM2_1_2]|nr:hypothetical protein [Richelia sp. RM2_1_2]